MKLISTLIATMMMTNAWGQMVWGEKVNVGSGVAQSFVKMHKKKPVEIGVALTETALTSLPHMMKEYSLPLPPNVSLVPYQHITLDWNPHGHEPDGVYNLPHFDVHFYMISESNRKQISCQGVDAVLCMQQPLPQYLVANYAPTPQGQPHMGWHWVDLLAPEFNGGIFTRTLIHGYYKGEPIFIEPMVTLDFLKSKVTSEEEVRLPESFPIESSLYPAGYKISYDSELKIHKIVLKDFHDEGP